MRKSTKMVIAAVVAALMLALAIGTASANRSIELRGGRSTSFGFSRLTFSAGGEGGLQITCEVSLLATISTLVPKTRGTLIGQLTGIKVGHGRCREPFGFATPDAIPLACREEAGGLCVVNVANLWRLFYDSFTGTLPGITGLNIEIANTQFLVRTLIGNCLYEGTANGRINIAGGAVTNATALPTTALTIVRRLSGRCDVPGSFRGESSNSTLRLSIALL